LTVGAGLGSAFGELPSSLPGCVIFASTGVSFEGVDAGAVAIGVILSVMGNLLVGR
jgi:hypothetical protein